MGSAGDGVRTLRAVVATLVVIGFGATAHQMGGGAPLQPIPALVVAALVGPIVWMCVRRRTSLPRMVAATAVGQVVTHLTLGGMAPTAGGGASRLHLHEVMAPMPLMPTSTSSPLALTSSMLVAHAVATLVVSLLLTAGVDVIRAMARRVGGRERVPGVVVQPWQDAGVHGGVRVLDGRVVGPVGGRAPPALPA